MWFLVQHVFKMEQDDYSKEEINWSYIEFIDSQDVLDFIERKLVGVISLLDEACLFLKSTNEMFATKLFNRFGNHQRISKPRLARTDFTLSHYVVFFSCNTIQATTLSSTEPHFI